MKDRNSLHSSSPANPKVDKTKLSKADSASFDTCRKELSKSNKVSCPIGYNTDVLFVEKDFMRRHYSYQYYARKDVVDNYDNDRYGSEFGKYLCEREINTFLGFLSPGGKVLDVGTGTGKLFLALRERGRDVIGLDASCSMLWFLRNKDNSGSLEGRLIVADIHRLTFKDNSFESVMSSRVLMHLVDWRQAISELCRVSKKEVILDFPPLSGPTMLVIFINRLKKLIKKDTCLYRVFSLRAIKKEFKKHNFEVVEVKRLFLLPVALHRYINNIFFSRFVEGVFERLCLTKLFGGPVIVKARNSFIPENLDAEGRV